MEALAVAIGIIHGSSLVSQDWLKVINTYSGDIAQTYEVSVDEIVAVIDFGFRKANIDNDLRIASTEAMRQYLAQEEHASDFD